MRLESEQIGSTVRLAALRRKRAALPRAVGGNDDPRADLPDLGAGREGAGETVTLPPDRDDAPRLPQRGAGMRGGIEQQEIEMLASQRATPSARGALRARQRRRQRSLAREQGDALYLRPSLLAKERADGELVEQRKGRGGDELTANLAAGKARLLDHRDRPARARQQERRSCARGSAADDERVIGHRRSGALRLATKQWVKSPLRFSSRFHAPSRGQRRASSSSAKPARTLATAS